MFAANLSAAPLANKLYVEDVFAAYLYTGNGSTQTINNGIDLAGKGGMVHEKTRGVADSHHVFDTVRGINKELATDSSAGEYTQTLRGGFYSTGYASPELWGSVTLASWTFRNAPNFFQVLQATKAAGSNLVIDLSQYFPSSSLGMVKVKRTDAAGSWYVWHRSLTAGKLLIGETTAAETTLGQITVSGTTLTLVDGVIADGTYHIEAYAHDTSANGLIQCGSFTTDASGNATFPLGWEAQFVIAKPASTTGNWFIVDSMRGFVAGINSNLWLAANSSNAESTGASIPGVLTATGLTPTGLIASTTFVCLAIRRGPMRKPTSGTQVYAASTFTGTTGGTEITAGFPVDLVISDARTGSTEADRISRLRGGSKYLASNSTAAESSLGTAFSFDRMTGIKDTNYGGVAISSIDWMLRRYPGVFDEICYNGSGANKTEPHNLTVQPEFWRAKRRDNTGNWIMGSTLLAATEKILLNSTAGKSTDATAWNSTYPTASSVSLGTLADVNASGGTYTMELYATTPGVSKVGRIACTGADMNIDAGFAAGARYIEIFRDDGTSSRYVFDSTRGIVAGNDPYLCLDSTAAEVTSTDYIDPYAAGFTVTAAAPWNVAGAHALYFAIA